MQYYPQGYSSAAPATSAISGASSVISHSNGLPPLQLGDTGVHSGPPTPQQAQSKRKQVKNACVNCQKACKKCDDERPCIRCKKYGIVDTCVNSVRKERKKGIKRGPYKRRHKQDGEKSTQKTEGLDQQQGQFGAAMGMHYEYTNYLNQCRQSYPFESYVPYKDHGVGSAFPLGYPVLGSSQQEQAGGQHPSFQTNQYNGIIQHSPQPSRSPVTSEQQQQNTSPQEQMPCPPLHAIKEEGKPQPLTPLPSTSTSSGASSPLESTEDDEGSKFARLSQLCSAALHHNRTESNHSQHST